MKVVHICVTDSGGAGLCCRRISQALKDEGIESSVLTMIKLSSDHSVTRIPWGMKWFLYRLLNKLQYKLHIPFTDSAKVKLLADKIGEPLSIPISIFEIEHHPLVINADVVHLHSIAGFVDLPSFFAKVKKPIIWTLHDENFFHGLCHFSRTKGKAGKIEEKYYKIKKDALQKSNRLGVVFLSEMMQERYKNHEFLADRPNVIINNPVDTEKFKPFDKEQARNYFKIDKNTLVFIFVAGRIDDPWKNLKMLCSAIEEIKIPNVIILAVGRNASGIELPDFVMQVGPINGTDELAQAYSAADFFVSTSYQESFAQTPLEAMSCGIPVILTPVSGTSELVRDYNGVRCEDFNKEDIVKGIKKAMNIKYDDKIIRDDMIKRYSPSIIARQYISFYNKMLDTN